MEQLLNCVMDLGEQMLISGGEVHRVEDSVHRILAAYDAVRTDVFIITSSIVVTVHTADGRVLTQTRRITETGTDFEKLHRLNALSRKVCAAPLPADEFRDRLDAITATKPYPFCLEVLCFAIIAGAFTLFFGGDFIQAAVSLVIGALVRLVMALCGKITANRIFNKFLASLCATALAFAALGLSLIPSVDKVIIGNIMTLIPGIGLTNALKDLLIGDSIAGLLRTIEACIAALAIAAGYFAVALLIGGAPI